MTGFLNWSHPVVTPLYGIEGDGVVGRWGEVGGQDTVMSRKEPGEGMPHFLDWPSLVIVAPA